jgi:uncharacterized membrane protein
VIALLAVLVATAWLVCLFAAPVLPGWAGAILYAVGSLICHQLPDRSFYLAGYQLPVCARCLGIYVGAACGAALVWMRSRRWENPLPVAPATGRLLAFAAAAPTVLTVALEAAGLWYPSNLVRAYAGFPLGGVVAFVVVNALATLHYRECAPPRPTVPKPPQRFI